MSVDYSLRERRRASAREAEERTLAVKLAYALDAMSQMSPEAFAPGACLAESRGCIALTFDQRGRLRMWWHDPNRISDRQAARALLALAHSFFPRASRKARQQPNAIDRAMGIEQ